MNDDEFRQAMATLEAYKVQLDAMAQQSNFFKLSLEETLRARDTLKAFANAKEGDDHLDVIRMLSTCTIHRLYFVT